MESLKIKIPKGYVVDEFNQKTGELKFKEAPKDIKDRIINFQDVLDYHEIDKEDFEEEYKNFASDELAYVQLKLLCSALNEGWTPNWDNSSEYKYVPWFLMGSSGFRYDVYDYWNSGSAVGSRLCFKSRDLAQYAAKQFEDIYKEYMLIK